jgi:shikimate kinase
MGSVKTVILVGFMGAGKSSVGQLLSQMTGWGFIDTDDMIEQAAGKTISEIFAEDGEPAFRELETNALNSLVDKRRSIIATGGGIILKKENRELLKQIGTTFYLKASPETIYERIKSETHRPLLAVDDPQKKIAEILNERADLYEGMRVIVETDGRTVKKIAATIGSIASQSM